MDSYVDSHVEPLDKLSSVFAAGKVVLQSFNALFWVVSRADTIIYKKRLFSWTRRPVDIIAEIANVMEWGDDRRCNQKHAHGATWPILRNFSTWNPSLHRPYCDGSGNFSFYFTQLFHLESYHSTDLTARAVADDGDKVK